MHLIDDAARGGGRQVVVHPILDMRHEHGVAVVAGSILSVMMEAGGRPDVARY
jgi:hypothetical protein